MSDGLDPRILNNPNEALERLRGASDEQIDQLVRGYLSLWLAPPGEPPLYADPDKLIYAGAAIGMATARSLDVVIAGWVAEERCDLRMDVASGFLWGYWSQREEIDLGMAEHLLQRASALAADSDAYPPVMFALIAAFHRQRANVSTAFFTQARQVLAQQREALIQHGSQPGIVDAIHRIVLRYRASQDRTRVSLLDRLFPKRALRRRACAAAEIGCRELHPEELIQGSEICADEKSRFVVRVFCGERPQHEAAKLPRWRTCEVFAVAKDNGRVERIANDATYRPIVR